MCISSSTPAPVCFLLFTPRSVSRSHVCTLEWDFNIEKGLGADPWALLAFAPRWPLLQLRIPSSPSIPPTVPRSRAPYPSSTVSLAPTFLMNPSENSMHLMRNAAFYL